MINDICMVIVLILVRKNGSHCLKIEEKLSQTLKMCQMRGGFDVNIPKINCINSNGKCRFVKKYAMQLKVFTLNVQRNL